MTEDEILEQYRFWLLKMARILLPARRNEWHDLAQEGWIAMWKALKTHDPEQGALPSWLTTAARLRMTDVVRRATWTGTVGARGHTRERPAAPVDPEWDWVVEAVGFSPDQIDRLLFAYHEGEIIAAINDLNTQQREYIYRRFWRDEQPDALIKEIGNRWVDAKPKLAERLRHLRVR